MQAYKGLHFGYLGGVLIFLPLTDFNHGQN